ncbi:MAG: radical SAM protein [Candidatus Cloacimonetes bacterium]|nr:radical SAM protein [Candidatus Cloacimonadota bacterium]
MNYQKISSDLPIYKIMHNNRIYLFAEGFAIPMDSENSVHRFITAINSQGFLPTAEQEIVNAAKKAKTTWISIHSQPFTPLCLTLIPNYDCNLACGYCFNAGDAKRDALISIECATRYAELVLKNCKEQQKTFVLVLAGGGEPTLHWELLNSIVDSIGKLAKNYGVSMFSYISTNGTLLTNEKVASLVSKFNLIGISYDCPPAIADKISLQGVKSNDKVKQICRQITDLGGAFDIRVTVHPETFVYQEEIVDYIIKHTGCKTIRIEPVYGFEQCYKNPEIYANEFVTGFLKAKRSANKVKVDLSYSGLRLHEVHSTYCDIFRHTLRIFPEGDNRICFLRKNNSLFTHNINEIDAFTGLLAADSELFNHKVFPFCESCIASYHCTRGCPDFCFIDNEVTDNMRFRCSINIALATELIIEQIDMVDNGQ